MSRPGLGENSLERHRGPKAQKGGGQGHKTARALGCLVKPLTTHIGPPPLGHAGTRCGAADVEWKGA